MANSQAMNSIVFLLLWLSAVACLSSASSTGNHRRLGSTTNDNRKLQFPEMDDMELPGWTQDWLNGTTSNTDWSSPNAWQDWFNSLWEGQDFGGGGEGFELCPILETAIGMTQSFGIAAECKCDGDMATEMEISCTFEDCLSAGDVADAVTSASEKQGDLVCGTIGMSFTFGGEAGAVTASVCADFPGEQYKETCFSYEISMASGNSPTQACQASYGGVDCDCSIESWCLNVNCSTILPGAAMDTCQYLSMQDGGDLASWLPQFQVFDSDFVLDADAIPWRSLDWDNLDWNNFNMSAVQWSSPDWLSETWTDLVGGVSDSVSSGVCMLMSKAVQMREELGLKGGCTCDAKNGLEMTCSFAELCSETLDGNGEPVCASANMTLGFGGTVSAVDNEVCVNYFGETHPETCFSYSIPVADKTAPPTCTAKYGGNECICTMDENFCLSVDCSEFEPSAVTDTCQFVNLNGPVEAERFMLAFQAPQEEVVVNNPSTEGETDVETSGNQGTTSSEVSSGGSTAYMYQTIATSLASASFLSVFLLHYMS
mmetsp:Transcript_28440/g.47270  ORF Transcript_28440/g.47270 Transcript_28440/m.47270 type:complete len:542 (-) Transcript_28440:92-1717(-)